MFLFESGFFLLKVMDWSREGILGGRRDKSGQRLLPTASRWDTPGQRPGQRDPLPQGGRGPILWPAGTGGLSTGRRSQAWTFRLPRYTHSTCRDDAASCHQGIQPRVRGPHEGHRGTSLSILPAGPGGLSSGHSPLPREGAVALSATSHGGGGPLRGAGGRPCGCQPHG